MTTLKQAYELGKDTGYQIGIGLLDDGDIETKDQLVTMGCDIEQDSYRQYSPFEFTAKEFNDSRDPDRTWEEYERGVEVGLRKAWRDRHPKRLTRRQALERQVKFLGDSLGTRLILETWNPGDKYGTRYSVVEAQDGRCPGRDLFSGKVFGIQEFEAAITAARYAVDYVKHPPRWEFRDPNDRI